jgi:hypothetical protein
LNNCAYFQQSSHHFVPLMLCGLRSMNE